MVDVLDAMALREALVVVAEGSQDDATTMMMMGFAINDGLLDRLGGELFQRSDFPAPPRSGVVRDVLTFAGVIVSWANEHGDELVAIMLDLLERLSDEAMPPRQMQ